MKSKQRNSIYLFASILLLSTQVYAQNTSILKLEEAIHLAIQNNQSIKIAKEKNVQATTNLQEAKNRRLPDFNINSQLLRVNQPLIDLRVKLNNSGSSGSSAPDVNQVVLAQANVAMPLFNGNKINYSIKANEYLLKAAELDANANKNELILNTIQAYTNLYKCIISLKLIKENKTQASKRLKDIEQLYKNNIVSRNDLLKAQLQVQQVELQQLEVSSELELSKINMNLLLGLASTTPLDVDSNYTNQLQIDQLTINSIDYWENLVMQERPELLSLNNRIEASKKNIQILKSDNYPSFALSGGYIYADINNFLGISNALNGGIAMRYSISSLWKGSEKITQAKSKTMELELMKSQLSDQVKLQVNKSFQQFVVAKQKINVFRNSIQQVSENYKIVESKYKNNLATVQELLDADVLQFQAKVQYEFAKADATIAYYHLLQVSNQFKFN
jgi:outer membrane protein TolC